MERKSFVFPIFQSGSNFLNFILLLSTNGVVGVGDVGAASIDGDI